MSDPRAPVSEPLASASRVRNGQASTSRWPWGAGRRGQRLVRYSLVSLVSVAVSQSVLAIAFGVLHWTAQLANVVACAVAAVPSFHLNRSWTWGRRGRSHLLREVAPFWALAFLGLAFSTWAADVGSTMAHHAAASHAVATAIVMASSLLAFALLWIGKFAIFNLLLFTEGHSRGVTQRHGHVRVEPSSQPSAQPAAWRSPDRPTSREWSTLRQRSST